MPAFMSFISFTSSTKPFSQVAMIRRCSPSMSGTFVTFLIATNSFAGSVRTSINVRRQLFLQKLQRVDSLRVVRYWILRTASRPTNVVCWPFFHRRSDSWAAPMAPDSPQCSWTIISGCRPAARKLFRIKSTSALTTARLFCVPPCNTNRVPSAARFGMLATYRNTFFGSTAARPARISCACQPCRWKLTMSDCMNTAQP